MESSKLKMIDQYFEGTLPREQWKEFSTQLSLSSELRREFRKRAVLDDYLHFIPQNVDSPTLVPRKRFNITPFPLVLLAACLVIGLTIITTTPDPVSNREVLSDETNSEIKETDSIAKLIDYHDTKISKQPTDPNEIKFNRGHYDVTHGSIHLRFLDCVDFLFSGPGSFEIVNSKFVKVTEGKIRVIVLNKKGHEFTIQTPTNQFIDWGTEFCLNVQQTGGDMINVHEGEVEVKSLQYSNFSERLNRNSQRFQHTENKTVSINKRLRNNIPGGMGDLRHQQLIKKLSEDKSVIGVYDFKKSRTNLDLLKQRIPVNWTNHFDQHRVYRFVENLHKTSEESSHGFYHGANRANGRWEKSIALNFYLKHAHLSLDLKNDYNHFSLSFWCMQTGKLKKPLNNLVSPYKWEKFGNLSIDISRSGKISQHLWGETNLSVINYGDSKIQEGWNHIVYTFGKEENEVRGKVFLNGKLVNEAMPRWTQHISLKQMIIGASINNEGHFYNGIRILLDELAIWKKTLTAEEIWHQYKNGLPIYDLPNRDIHFLAKNRDE